MRTATGFYTKQTMGITQTLAASFLSTHIVNNIHIIVLKLLYVI